MENMVDHPKHYVSGSGIECINVIRPLPHCLATCVKYVWRHRDKWNPVEDLEKAMFYLNDFDSNLNYNPVDGLAVSPTMLLGSQEVSINPDFFTHLDWLEDTNKPEYSFFLALEDLICNTSAHGKVNSFDVQMLRSALAILQLDTRQSME